LGARNRLNVLVEIIGSGDAGIPRAVIAQIEVVARCPVDALHLLEADIEIAAVIKPQNLGLLGNRNRVSGIGQNSDHHGFEFRTARGRSIDSDGQIAWRVVVVALQIARRCVQEG